MASSTLGDILNISLAAGQAQNCFGITSIPGGTRPCKNTLGKEKLSDARIILVQTLPQLERNGTAVEEHLRRLSELLVQAQHGLRTQSQRDGLIAQWQDQVERYRREQEAILPFSSRLQDRSENWSQNTPEVFTPEISFAGGPAAPALPAVVSSPSGSSLVSGRTEFSIPQVQSGVEYTRELPSDLSVQTPEHCDLGSQATVISNKLSDASIAVDEFLLINFWTIIIQFCFGCRAFMQMRLGTLSSHGTGRISKDAFVELKFLLLGSIPSVRMLEHFILFLLVVFLLYSWPGVVVAGSLLLVYTISGAIYIAGHKYRPTTFSSQ
ncbi:hypothetical protein N7532_002638 [Penicillium argentinense]|uniref:Transmembrane protein n=1 Tax=Penicillium argentinense TaxID=1131581 RepID=A0A9W9KLN2_9EURO|nr:uncharacterized protein N7532_002638 [Penicillium argentinense]KAJ5109993.1 hypothetical protein N7532_002638 [Penicillium argentinense]